MVRWLRQHAEQAGFEQRQWQRLQHLAKCRRDSLLIAAAADFVANEHLHRYPQRRLLMLCQRSQLDVHCSRELQLPWLK
jgi:hypothetical protein